MLLRYTKLLLLFFFFLMISVAVYPQNTITEDPLQSLNIEETIKKQLIDFQEQLKEYVKNPSNIALMEQGLPNFIRDYELYLRKYYTTVKAIDPTVSIYDLPEVDRIIKQKFGWSTYDLMQEHERLVEKLQTEILPYIEAEAYEKVWNENPVIKISETNKENIYRYEYMMKKLGDAEKQLSEYITKWEAHQKKAIKNIEGYSKKVRSYTHSTQNAVWENPSGEGFIAGENNTKTIPNIYNFGDYVGQQDTKDLSADQALGIGA
ncbi:MAG: hypothetical protein WCQ47_09115, partial [bacterium]